MTYGAETWALTNQARNKLAAARTKVERSMLNITYRDRKDRQMWKQHVEAFAQPRDTMGAQ